MSAIQQNQTADSPVQTKRTWTADTFVSLPLDTSSFDIEADDDDCEVIMDDEETTLSHVDEWIDAPHFYNDGEAYAKLVLMLFRLPAWQKIAFSKWTRQFKLFCMYKGEEYRVTGASRMGDIWLTKDFNQDIGYELRVDLTECSEWAEGPVNAG